MTSEEHDDLFSAARKSLNHLPRSQHRAILAELDRLAATVRFMLDNDLQRPATAKHEPKRRKRG